MKVVAGQVASGWVLALALVLLGYALRGPATLGELAVSGIALLRPAQPPKGVVLLIGDTRSADAAYAAALRAQDYVVVTIPLALAQAADDGGCAPRALWLRAIGQRAQAVTAAPGAAPIIIGLGAGAALVPALAGSGALQPHAAISVDYCAASVRAQCAGASVLLAPWYAFEHRNSDPRCQTAEVERMTTDASNAHLTWLEAGSATANPVPAEVTALTQWLDPRLSDQVAASSGPAAHLPLIEQPVAGARRAVIFISGDGGWAQLDRTVSAQLNAAGIAVVGWDALSYFWRARQPQDIADDLARIMVLYRSRWGIERFTVVGYSFGANVLPFALNRLPAAAAAVIDKVVLLGPSANTSFEFHLREWLGHGPAETAAVTPEISALKLAPVVCVRGRDDDDARCPSLTPPSRTVTVAGDHHFAGDYAGLAALIAAPLSAAR